MFGKLIKEYRKTTKLSQEEMAYKLGISANHLSRIERYKTYPSGALINSIIDTIANDINIINFKTCDTSLYGIILLIYINTLSDSQRNIIFSEVMNMVKKEL